MTLACRCEFLAQSMAHKSLFIGEFHDDKRHGYGLFRATSGWGYLGSWQLGTPHGSGFEIFLGKTVHNEALLAEDDSPVPMLVSFIKMHQGKLVKRDRFDHANASHARVLRRAGLAIDRARKRASLSRQLARRLGDEECVDGPACLSSLGWQQVDSAEHMCHSATKL